jgi:DNA replication and repair protein RecF
MSLILKKLELHNFRNHHTFCIENPQRLIIIIGRNATGKTNIIEAIQLVSMLESFRNPLWQNVVNTREDEADIRAQFLQNERLIDIQMNIKEGKRSYLFNGKKRAKHTLKGIIPSVVFIPDDLSLVKDSPEVRRKLLDDTGQQLSETYREISYDYQKTVRQRNAILKTYQEYEHQTTLLDSWDESLIKLGALLFVHRIKLYKRLMNKAVEFYCQFSEHEKLTSRYIPSFHRLGDEYQDDELVEMEKHKVEELLHRTQELVCHEERMRAKSLFGPHRDEISFFIEGYNARQYGSQGQQRSIALALKLAQLTLIQDISGNQPLLLLDDVMSELDESRRVAFIKVIDGQIPTIITATDLNCFNDNLLKQAQIITLS